MSLQAKNNTADQLLPGSPVSNAASAGFHRIGFHPILSFIAIFVIHLTFSYWSLDSWIPDPRLPIYTKNIHRTRHGSDSHIYDSEGRFIPVRPRLPSPQPPDLALCCATVLPLPKQMVTCSQI